MPLRIAVTGATGFVGRHVVRALVAAGHEVIALLRPGAPLAAVGVPMLVEWLAPSVSPERMKLAPLLARCDTVIHAANAYGRASEPRDAPEVANVRLPLALLDAAAAVGCARFIHLDTFFSRPGVAHSYLPAYTETKRRFVREASEALALNRLLLINAQLEHVYGPEDAPTKFVPWLIDQLLGSTQRVLLTSGTQRRDFVHVHDVAGAIARLSIGVPPCRTGLMKLEIGSGRDISIREFVELTHRLCGSKAALDFGGRPDERQEIQSSCADISRLRALGFVPHIPLDVGLGMLISERRRVADAV